jgi:signal transduction histidine kinase/CheY-like chemotaxis protein
MQLAARDGTPHDFIIKIRPISLGGKRYLIGIWNDVTEAHQLERHLRQAQKMEAIGTLAGGIAHDFNNILSAILGYTELSMVDTQEGSLIHGNLLKIYSAGERARDLVKQILSFSRQSEQELLPIRIKPIIQEALKLLRASIPVTIEIQSEIDYDPTILADPTQIHQVMMNLCTNASHAMEDNGGILTIQLRSSNVDPELAQVWPELPDPEGAVLSIRDTGSGMDAPTLERIFDPFFTTKQRDKGTGMGLAVVHGIVESHKGRIKAISKAGEGTTFYVFFPVISIADDTRIESRASLPTGTERILFIDDEPTQVEIGSQALGRLGYRVTTMTDSLEALKLFEDDPMAFDLVISDMTMPQLTGDRLAEAILNLRADIPILLCTGYSERIEASRAQQIGIRNIAMKPLIIRELAELVRSVLDESLSSQASSDD